MVIHGGYWRAQYDLALGRPLAVDLNRHGWSTLNLEYRRVGNGGGAPETFDDIAAGIDLLATLVPGYDGPVVALGHSAGGHLAVWAAARGRFGWPERVRLTHVISQAGVLDLRAAHRDGLSNDAVTDLLGSTVAEARFDPSQQLPLDVPVTCLHAADDDAVPISQSLDYVAASQEAVARATAGVGGETPEGVRGGQVREARADGKAVAATHVEVAGGHFDLIHPGTDSWAAVLASLPSESKPTDSQALS